MTEALRQSASYAVHIRFASQFAVQTLGNLDRLRPFWGELGEDNSLQLTSDALREVVTVAGLGVAAIAEGVGAGLSAGIGAILRSLPWWLYAGAGVAGYVWWRGLRGSARGGAS